MITVIYNKSIGSAKLDIKKAVAGKKINCRLVFKVGSCGIRKHGSLKLLFRTPSDYDQLQFTDSLTDNYVKISCSNKNISIKINSRINKNNPDHYTRPWTRGISLDFIGSDLKKGDQIYFEFNNWYIQTFVQNHFLFQLTVDPSANGKYIFLPKSPRIEIISGIPDRLVIVAPTTVRVEERFKVLVKLEDRWGNVCTNINGSCLIKANKNIKNLPSQVNLKSGQAIISGYLIEQSTVRITASYKKKSAKSNPIVGLKKDKLKQYWADLHGQSEETIGTGSLTDYFNFAKKYSFLDVIGHQGNDFELTDKFWKQINQTTERMNKDGKFIIFPGYEWSGNTENGGDHNVIYSKEDMPIIRSSFTLLDRSENRGQEAKTIKQLFKKLPKKDVLLIAHAGGRYANLKYGSDNIRRAVEIHSAWGGSEWLLQDALANKEKIGVVAGSDDHKGTPGASYPGEHHFGSQGGLTCILANKLSRRNIFQAIYNRHTYGTTGARIFMDIKCLDSGKEKGIMGDIIKSVKNPILQISIKATSPIDRIEIWNKDKIINRYSPELIDKEKNYIKIIWSGAQEKGKGREYKWQGKLSIQNNSINGVKKINFFRRSNTLDYQKKLVSWQGNTNGGLQGLIIALDKNSGQIMLNVNSKNISVSIKAITQKPIAYQMGGLNAQLEIYRVESDNHYQDVDLQYSIKKLNRGDNPIWVKIFQKDGHMAWSSPIYIQK